MNYTRDNATPGTHTSRRRIYNPRRRYPWGGGGFEPPKLARQIYSLIPLATREPLRKGAHSLDLDPLCQRAGGNSALLAALANDGCHCVCDNWQAFLRQDEMELAKESNPDRLITNQLLYY